MYANTQQPNAHLDQLRSELPTHESSAAQAGGGGGFKPTHGGVGSLPGGYDESGVAQLPEERVQESRGQNYTSSSQPLHGDAASYNNNNNTTGQNFTGSRSQPQTVPGTAQPLRDDVPYDTTHAQQVSTQQETATGAGAGASIPGTRTHNDHSQAQTNQPPPSHTQQQAHEVEGDASGEHKPSIGQRVKQGIKNMTGK